MVSDKSTDYLKTLTAKLEDDQRIMVDEAPRQNRLPLLAQFLRRPEIDIIKEIGKSLNLEIVEEFSLLSAASRVVPMRLIHEYQCLPFQIEKEGPSDDSKTEPEAELKLITLWPPEPGMDDWIYAVCGRNPKWYLGPTKTIINCITQNFGIGSDSLGDSESIDEDMGRDLEEEEDENAALIRFVNEVIQKAVDDRATDIHFEPLKESLQIRYRIDGELVPIRVPDNLINFQSAIISRLKIMAKLNISEKRRPQDGRIAYRAGVDELDIRISTMPTMYGESISLRLLNQKNQPLSFEELGLLKHERDRIDRVLALPHGIVLVTGPTGHGKSTSLTAFIRQINSPGRRIITIEEPIEYEVPGVNQMQVRHEIGFTFANALRHILRQDPDVIMVGEIRDQETADIAIRAALTGHLVLSTIHTNDAPGALTRLIDMEIEPFLIASSVEQIISQRLVRRMCPHCQVPIPPNPVFIEESLRTLEIEPTPEEIAATVFEPTGCEFCRQLGYRGRVGIFEILRIDDRIHEMIVKKKSARQIRETAIADNSISTLQQSGWNQVKLGRTSIQEIIRFSKLND